MTADTLIVLISLLGAGPGRTVEALYTKDSTLWLPSAEVHELLGLPTPTAPWTTTAAVLRDWPTVTASWDLRSLALVFVDPLGVLPATRAAQSRQDREAHGAPPLQFSRSGPFAAFAVDELDRYAIDLGYSYRGRLAVAGRTSSVRGTSWTVAASPWPYVYATVSGQHVGVRAQPRITSASGRLAVGPLWVAPTYFPITKRLEADGLVALGNLHVFVSTRNTWLVTFRSPTGDLQFGQSRGLYAARASFGAIPASPFGFPLTY